MRTIEPNYDGGTCYQCGEMLPNCICGDIEDNTIDIFKKWVKEINGTWSKKNGDNVQNYVSNGAVKKFEKMLKKEDW